MADGSGLSRFNLITPHETVQLLLTMAHSPYRDAFYSSLAVTGEEGTLRNRPRETSNAAPFNVRAKTGTMAHVRNLSGYITTKSGELLAFSLLCNNHSSPKRCH
jgi:D-alanyl-D-alanine carboxypeptidase/D-alanyl-D-alanine-endopeptidase (penicillin-binding protein 4)